MLSVLVVVKVRGGGDAALERWRQFTPTDIVVGRCMARTWFGGKGGQCKSKCVGDSDFCRSHGGGRLAHGRVDGDIPDSKYREFVNELKNSMK